MTRRNVIGFIICVLLHAYVLVNVYVADQLTPRIIHLTVIKPCQQ